MKAIIQHLEQKGMPAIWQLLVLALIVHPLLLPFAYKNQDLVHSLLILSMIPFMIGLFAAFNAHEDKNIPRIILLAGIAIVGTGINLQNMIYFNFSISYQFTLVLKEIGIILIVIFSYIHLMMLEKKFNIKGYAVDYTMLIISCFILVTLVYPNFFSTLTVTLDLNQKILAFNILVGCTILGLSLIHYFMTYSLGLTDFIRVFLTVLLVLHFALELYLSFENSKHQLLLFTLAQAALYLAGALSIAFVFFEDLSLNFPSFAPSRLGNVFMWVSSIFAIIVIPLGLVIRYALDAPPVNLLIVGLTSILISTCVIWRIIILIKNSNQQKERLDSLITTNSLSGIPNYQGYLEQLTLSNLNNVLVAHINIEDFKSINDLYGREVGDDVLRNIARKLEQLPDCLIAAHIHADQFLVAFNTEESKIRSLIESIQNTLGIWDNIQGHSIAVPFTIGASFNETPEPEQLAKQAETALKQARKKHSSYELYVEDENNNNIPRHELRKILQESVDNNFLPVHFQPIYNLEDGSLKAVELLIRVHSKKHGLLLPGQFLEQAKSYALLTSLTQICIKMIAEHREELKGIIVNINLPPYMLKSTKLLRNFIRSFEDEKLDPKQFCIEITEDEEISAHELVPAVKILKNNGFSIAMDDFGTGYSSLDRLSILDVDSVKIDRSILLTAESGNTTILEWAISLAKRLNVAVVVEGVETEEQLSLVKLLNADSVQGFLYSKPIAANLLSKIPHNSKDIQLI